MRYYSTQRPITPGSYPKENVISIENFDDKNMSPKSAVMPGDMWSMTASFQKRKCGHMNSLRSIPCTVLPSSWPQ